jgi:hypothetical protein
MLPMLPMLLMLLMLPVLRAPGGAASGALSLNQTLS